MAESFVDSFETELIADRVWKTNAHLELAIAEYIGWFNDTRLHGTLGDLPPAEFESRALRARAASKGIDGPDHQQPAPRQPVVSEVLIM